MCYLHNSQANYSSNSKYGILYISYVDATWKLFIKIRQLVCAQRLAKSGTDILRPMKEISC